MWHGGGDISGTILLGKNQLEYKYLETLDVSIRLKWILGVVN